MDGSSDASIHPEQEIRTLTKLQENTWTGSKLQIRQECFSLNCQVLYNIFHLYSRYVVHFLVHSNFDLVRSLLARKVAQFKCFFVYFRSKISSPTLVLFVVLGGATIHPFDYLALKHLPRQLSRHPSNYVAGNSDLKEFC